MLYRTDKQTYYHLGMTFVHMPELLPQRDTVYIIQI